MRNKGLICSIEDCGASAFCRGWCSKHYARWQTKGDPLKLVKESGLPCLVPNCGRDRHGNGFCGKHYARALKHGSPAKPIRPGVHHLSDVDKDSLTGVCILCGPVKLHKVGRHQQSFVCGVSDNARRKWAQKDRALRNKFGITLDDYKAMLKEQGGVCAICHQTCPSGRELAMDHNHKTGKPRKLLCGNCNRGLGYFKDDPILLRAAADYTEAT